jgi:hypothetical protein
MELSFKERFLIAEFKASSSFETPGIICELNLMSDLPSKLCDNERKQYGVFSRNCLVIEQEIVGKQESRFFSYVFDPLGYPTIIPESAKFSKTLDDAVSWLESDDFSANKALFISAATPQLHELAQDTVFLLCKGFVQDPLYRRHRRFRMEYEAWLAEQVDDEGLAVF